MRTFAIAAITIDGRIALGPDHYTNWTSPQDKAFLKEMLDSCDAIVVGNNTYKTAAKELAKRNCIVLTHSVHDTKRAADNLLYLNTDGADLAEAVASYKTVGILGGAQTYVYCLEHDLLDDLYLTVEPIAFGKGIGVFDGLSAEKRFKLESMRPLSSDGAILLLYRSLTPSVSRLS